MNLHKPDFLIKGLPTLNQRRLTGGKNLDGSFFIEIEGSGRVVLSPQQVLDMCMGYLRELGINIEFGPPPQ